MPAARLPTSQFTSRSLRKAGSILVVDDDEDDQFLICQVLSQYLPSGSVQTLSDGEELLDELAQCSSPPGLVLLDLNMPRMGGLAALAAVRHQTRYQALPVVILTTSDSKKDQSRAHRLQATDYIVKPATFNELNQLLLKLIERWL